MQFFAVLTCSLFSQPLLSSRQFSSRKIYRISHFPWNKKELSNYRTTKLSYRWKIYIYTKTISSTQHKIQLFVYLLHFFKCLQKTKQKNVCGDRTSLENDTHPKKALLLNT